MKALLKIFLITFGALFSVHALAAPETVPFVNLDRYVGVWYQIAHVPQFFQGGVCVCARQKLTAGQNGVVGVYNSCNQESVTGRLRDIRGEATNDDPTTNARFTVDFGFPWKGSYWIVGLDADYRYAVVTDKDARTLYILSKTPVLAQELYDEAYAIALKQELNTADLIMTVQQGCQYPN
jgi:apolipoprotein D and lipocalin family protein